MMRAPGRMIGDAPLQRLARGQDRPADGRGRPLENARKYRVFERAEIVALAHRDGDMAAGIGLVQGRDIGRIVKTGQCCDIGGRAFGQPVFQPAEAAAQIDRHLDPRDRQGMVPAIGGPPVKIARDKDRRGEPHRHALDRSVAALFIYPHIIKTSCTAKAELRMERSGPQKNIRRSGKKSASDAQRF